MSVQTRSEELPELKKWIKIPDDADREDSDDSDGDRVNGLPALNASEQAVTRSISFSHCKLWDHYMSQSLDIDGSDERPDF